VHAPIVVAADGIHSVVRRDRIGGHAPRFSGQTGLWGIGPGTLPGDAARHFTELWGDGVRMGFTAVTGGAVYWFLVVRERELPTDLEARKALVLDRAAPFPAALVSAARGTPADRIHVNPLWDLSPLRRWWVPGAVGLGDAVHATTPNLGQGGCQALEDAVALAGALDTHPDPSDAFAAYQAARWRRASAVTLLARWLGDLAQLGGPLRHFRNVLVGTTPAALVRPVLRWVMTPP
jgi:2-polyprenyl-6-methoxyphenol hydroxylase-like FAD-dependent oxidoreductase